nr:MFS transporter [Plantibacter sp. VKM Ac-1784]
MTALLAACVAFQLNASMLSPALVSMARELQTDDATIGLSQTMFFTTAALFSVFLPRLSDIIGRKRVLTGMLVVMLVGTVVAALAVNVDMLFVGRIIQGVSGPVVPITLLMLRAEVTDPKRYGAMMGLITAVNGGIAGIDALAGGWLVTNHGFRSVFWTMAVIAAVAIVFVVLWAANSQPSKGTRMDWWGVLPLVVSIAALLTAFNEAGKLAAADWLLVGGFIVVALVGWLVGPFAGRLAPTLGYLNVLRIGLIGSIVSIVIMALVGVHSLPVLIATTVLIGATYAGIGNIMLNGLGIVLSPKENPGFLPGLNAGAFNLGAGLSFVVLPAVQIAVAPAGGTSTAGYTSAMLVGAGITAVALLVSFLIPKPASAEVRPAETASAA